MQLFLKVCFIRPSLGGLPQTGLTPTFAQVGQLFSGKGMKGTWPQATASSRDNKYIMLQCVKLKSKEKGTQEGTKKQ